MKYFLTGILLCQLGVALPHLDLEMTGDEYQSLIVNRDDGEFDDELDPVMKLGKRYFEWLKKINESRPKEKQISISNPQNQPGYPIEQPKYSSPKIILDLFAKLKTELPEGLKKNLVSIAELPSIPPGTDEEFIVFGRRIDSVYGMASRWILQKPYLWAYSAKKHSDIRGYYYLSQILDIEQQLTNWGKLPAETQNQYTEWLQGLCFNSGDTDRNCQSLFEKSLKDDGNPTTYYHSFLKAGLAKWNELLLIDSKRQDTVWVAQDSELLKVPFQKPESFEVEEFLKRNIEDEWRLDNWKLNLEFVQGDYNTTHVEFIPGATPHVNGLAGSTITMDAKQPLSEYHVQWTIRHEYGHTLGFPDCYIEFYDADKGLMVSYQVDTTNIMCSRKGKLQKKHFEELKRVYFHP